MPIIYTSCLLWKSCFLTRNDAQVKCSIYSAYPAFICNFIDSLNLMESVGTSETTGIEIGGIHAGAELCGGIQLKGRQIDSPRKGWSLKEHQDFLANSAWSSPRTSVPLLSVLCMATFLAAWSKFCEPSTHSLSNFSLGSVDALATCAIPLFLVVLLVCFWHPPTPKISPIRIDVAQAHFQTPKKWLMIDLLCV